MSAIVFTVVALMKLYMQALVLFVLFCPGFLELQDSHSLSSNSKTVNLFVVKQPQFIVNLQNSLLVVK